MSDIQRQLGVRLCSIDGCDRKHYGRGWCSKHYQRWERNGTTDPPLRSPDRPFGTHERFWAKVDLGHPCGCWEWLGRKVSRGYGRFGYRAGRPAHRLAYEEMIGSIPEGLVLDHLCRNPGCVNPIHLEPVTQGENVRRTPHFQAKVLLAGLAECQINGCPRRGRIIRGMCRMHYERRRRTGDAGEAAARPSRWPSWRNRWISRGN